MAAGAIGNLLECRAAIIQVRQGHTIKAGVDGHGQFKRRIDHAT